MRELLLRVGKAFGVDESRLGDLLEHRSLHHGYMLSRHMLAKRAVVKREAVASACPDKLSR